MSDEFDSFFNEIGQPKGVTIYSGQQATVFQHGQDHCIKVYKKLTMYLDDIKRIDGIINNLINEQKLTHTLKYDEIFDTTKQYAVQMKRGNSLKTYFSSSRKSLFEKCALMYHMIVAVEELHDNNITHLDIKPENMVLFDQDGYQDLKLIDFEISQNQLKDIIPRGGSDMYQSPDSSKQKSITYKADNWSLGVIFYLMIIGFYEVVMETPKFHQLDQDIIQSTIKSQISSSDIGTRLSEMVSQLLNPQPTVRMELSSARVIILKILNLIPEITMFHSIFKFQQSTIAPYWLFDNYGNFYDFQLTHKLSETDDALIIKSNSYNWTCSSLSGSQEKYPVADILKYELGSHQIFNTHLIISIRLNTWVSINKDLIWNLQQDQFLNCAFCLTRYAEQCKYADKQDFQYFCYTTFGFTFKEFLTEVPLKELVSQMMLLYFLKENQELERCIFQILVDDDFSNLPNNLIAFQNKNKFLQINSQIMREFNSQYYFTINCYTQQELSLKGLAKQNDKENYKGQQLWIYYLPKDFVLLSPDYQKPRDLQAMITVLIQTSKFLYKDGKMFKKIHNSAINFSSCGYCYYRCIPSQIIPLPDQNITEGQILKSILDYTKSKTKQSVIDEFKFYTMDVLSFSHFFKADDVTSSQRSLLLSYQMEDENNEDLFTTWIMRSDTGVPQNNEETI